MSSAETEVVRFADLNLAAPLLAALESVGYETPSPIQSATIPLLLEGRDVLGQAQTGTGKTAAFALPALQRLDLTRAEPQVLVLTPTRELAIQVAEAFQRYASKLPGFHVLPIYGGQSYGPQLSALRRGVHVVVGTPGRIIDHLEKGSLQLDALRVLVLDEADEMLRMGFIDEVERILKRIPQSRQTALFSATMPAEIKRIAKTYLRDAAEVTVAAKTTTSDHVRQRYWMVSGLHKLDALTRILEAETFDAMIIFARTKMATEELSQKLQARGFSAAAINGDLAQQQRERTVGQLKDGQIDILVATDVAARGLDVERISHVINYDVPYDPESYVHRIGRTGRAGRKGEAILFISPRERGLLRAIERSTRQAITPLELPSIQTINNVRIARFKKQILDTVAAGELEVFTGIVEDLEREHNLPAAEIAAALAKLSRRGVPLLIDRAAEPAPAPHRSAPRAQADSRPAARTSETSFGAPESGSERAPRSRAPRPSAGERDRDTLAHFLDDGAPEQPAQAPATARPRAAASLRTSGELVPYRVEVGALHGIKPGNLVGAIANEIGLDSRQIGRVDIRDGHSLVELPSDLPATALRHLQTVQVAGRALLIRPPQTGTARPAADRTPRARPWERDSAPKDAPPRKAPRTFDREAPAAPSDRRRPATASPSAARRPLGSAPPAKRFAADKPRSKPVPRKKGT